MGITTENELCRMLKELALEDEEACVCSSEYLYENLPNAYLAQKLSDSQSGDEYDAWLLAIETTDGFDETLQDVTHIVEQIKYLILCRDYCYEVPA